MVHQSTVLSITPNIMVTNVRKSIQFYQDYLGFELRAWAENEKDESIYDLAILESFGGALMLQSIDSIQIDAKSLQPNGIGQGGFLFVKVLDLKELVDELKGKVKFANEIYQSDLGTTQINMLDPDGYNIILAQEDIEVPEIL